MVELIAFLQTPLGAAVLVIAAYLLKRYVPGLLPLLQRIAPKLPLPALPSPDPVPLAPATPSDRPLLDAAVEVLKALARKQFPWLTQEQAMLYFAQKVDQEYEAKKAEEAKATLNVG
jgi:hypothetical protein